MTLRRFEALRQAAALLKKNHRDENIGEILLCARLGLSRTKLLANIREPLSPPDAAWLNSRVTEHAVYGKPVQYMIGHAPFYGRFFKVTPDVLIPRQETEELVYRTGVWAARHFPGQGGLSVCDIGTGSGAIAVTLALEHPDWSVTAVDVSAEALAVAEQNARLLGASVVFRQGNLLEPLAGLPFDLLVSNPPYVTSRQMETLRDTVVNYEPRLALDGGPDGLDFYRKIIAGADEIGGRGQLMMLAFEIGSGQGRAVETLIRRTFLRRLVEIAVEKDVAGFDRNVMAVIRTDPPE